MRPKLHHTAALRAVESYDAYGHEILFVGSGGVFRYDRADDAKRNLHREFVVMLTPHQSCPRSRFGTESSVDQ